MKRFGTILIVALLIIASAFALVGCNKKDTNFDSVKSQISHIQKEILQGKTDNFRVKLISGSKEKDFVIDGKVGDLKEFTSLSVTPINIDMYEKTFTFKLIGKDGEITGELKKNILGTSFNADITDRKKIGELVSVEITGENVSDNIALIDILKDCIDADKALESAYNAVKDDLKSEFVDGRFTREVFIKLINDRNSADSPYYWYVSMMKDTNSFISILINPSDGKIISIKK